MNALDPDSLGYILLALASIAVLGFFACAEHALLSLSRARYQHLTEERGGRFGAIGAFVEKPLRFVEAMRVGRLLASLVLATSATLFSLRLALPDYGLFLVAVGTLAAALVAGHAFPQVSQGRAEETARALAIPIRLFTSLLSPLTAVTRSAATLFRTPPRSDEGEDATEELREMLAERVVEEEEREMIDSIFELEETTARECMVPRMDVVALQADTLLPEAMDVIIKHGYSRLPVYGQSIDDVVGILYAKDLFPLVRAGTMTGRVGDLVRAAYFIPESKKVDELLRELQKRKVHIAVVVDEYGGTAGLITIEDLLEEIVGEIQDEFDAEEAKIVEGKEGEAIFDATVSIDDVNDTLDLHLQGEEVDTIGGLVYERLGKVPLVGDQVEADGATVTVVATSGRRITRVKVARVAAENASESSGAQPV